MPGSGGGISQAADSPSCCSSCCRRLFTLVNEFARASWISESISTLAVLEGKSPNAESTIRLAASFIDSPSRHCSERLDNNSSGIRNEMILVAIVYGAFTSCTRLPYHDCMQMSTTVSLKSVYSRIRKRKQIAMKRVIAHRTF